MAQEKKKDQELPEIFRTGVLDDSGTQKTFMSPEHTSLNFGKKDTSTSEASKQEPTKS